MNLINAPFSSESYLMSVTFQTVTRKVRRNFEETHYLTGALWPVSSKAIQFAKSAILSAHSLCRVK